MRDHLAYRSGPSLDSFSKIMLCNFTSSVSAVSFGNIPRAQEDIGQNMCGSSSTVLDILFTKTGDAMGSESRGF